jgi:hypothetical protein
MSRCCPIHLPGLGTDHHIRQRVRAPGFCRSTGASADVAAKSGSYGGSHVPSSCLEYDNFKLVPNMSKCSV